MLLELYKNKHTQQVTGVSCSIPGIPIGNHRTCSVSVGGPGFRYPYKDKRCGQKFGQRVTFSIVDPSSDATPLNLDSRKIRLP